MEKLPQDIKLDIFSRLPAESILEYKRVCKSWLSLLEDPSFPQIHLRRQLYLLRHQYLNTPAHDGTTIVPCGGGGGVELGFTLVALSDSHQVQLLYKKYDENDEQSCEIVKKINHPLINNIETYMCIPPTIIMGSCNGLICLSIPSGKDIGNPNCIFNPITREYVNLPRSFGGQRNFKRYKIINGFGYHPSTNEYKVVRIFYSKSEENLGHVQVYTLGAGSGWRDKGQVTYSFGSLNDGYMSNTGTLANGKLHWLDKEGKIVAFNLGDEEFNLIPSPPIVYFDGKRDKFPVISCGLCKLGGWLGLAHYVCLRDDSHVNIWLLKKESTTGYDMNEQEHECWGWSKEFTIRTSGLIDLLGLTKRGEVLFWSSINYLCRYDPKSATIEKLSVGREPFCTEVIPHINSFVSLKGLGEQRRRR